MRLHATEISDPSELIDEASIDKHRDHEHEREGLKGLEVSSRGETCRQRRGGRADSEKAAKKRGGDPGNGKKNFSTGTRRTARRLVAQAHIKIGRRGHGVEGGEQAVRHKLPVVQTALSARISHGMHVMERNGSDRPQCRLAQ